MDNGPISDDIIGHQTVAKSRDFTSLQVYETLMSFFLE